MIREFKGEECGVYKWKEGQLLPSDGSALKLTCMCSVSRLKWGHIIV